MPHAVVATSPGESATEQFAVTPGAIVDNGDKDMEDHMSDQKAPSVQDDMDTFATVRNPGEVCSR